MEARGAITKEAVVEGYLRGLVQKNLLTIVRLTPKTHYSEPAAQAKIDQFGGYTQQNIQVDYTSNFGTQRAIVRINGLLLDKQGKQTKFIDQVHLEQIDGRWFLILGQNNSINSSDLPGKPSELSPPQKE